MFHYISKKRPLRLSTEMTRAQKENGSPVQREKMKKKKKISVRPILFGFCSPPP
ncbi:hypothetical protein AXF42_Ash008732 [Apostasia shenzhenica]|uniref:Uncharacterized protein n=1 Tax=Apostasia shenzhenica TaxID=1088818 RepID=A0A2I0B281_9ASPA|nr:hypothetical protein AXF42_Ash008732 [Apostasia shenzhenica]